MLKTPSRSALLARELLGRIARRELRPGDPIDVPALGRRHGVSRTVVREALADLGGKGMVVARPKVGTTVAPEDQWNLLDPALVAVAIAEPGPESMLHEATGLRRVVEPAIAAQAARDAGRTQRGAILDAARALAGAVGAGDASAFAAADATLHATIAAACSNRLLRSIDHALVPVRALHRERTLAAAGSDAVLARALGPRAALALAVARGDAGEAATKALALVAYADLGAPVPAPVPAALGAVVPRPQQDRGAGTPVPRPIGTVPAARQPADWPDTVTMPRDDDPFAPVRRGSVDATDATAAPIPVPALLADATRGAPALAAGR